MHVCMYVCLATVETVAFQFRWTGIHDILAEATQVEVPYTVRWYAGYIYAYAYIIYGCI